LAQLTQWIYFHTIAPLIPELSTTMLTES